MSDIDVTELASARWSAHLTVHFGHTLADILKTLNNLVLSTVGYKPRQQLS